MYWGDQIMENEMGGGNVTLPRRAEMRPEIWRVNLKKANILRWTSLYVILWWLR